MRLMIIKDKLNIQDINIGDIFTIDSKGKIRKIEYKIVDAYKQKEIPYFLDVNGEKQIKYVNGIYRYKERFKYEIEVDLQQIDYINIVLNSCLVYIGKDKEIKRAQCMSGIEKIIDKHILELWCDVENRVIMDDTKLLEMIELINK